jgi:hypothetical protein
VNPALVFDSTFISCGSSGFFCLGASAYGNCFFIRDTSSIHKIGYSQVSALCIVAAHSYMPGRCNLLIVTRIASCNATMCFIWAVHFYYINYLSLSIQLVLIMFVSVLLLFH